MQARNWLLILCLVWITVQSCQIIHIEKRKYTKGWYIQRNDKVLGLKNGQPDKEILANVPDKIIGEDRQGNLSLANRPLVSELEDADNMGSATEDSSDIESRSNKEKNKHFQELNTCSEVQIVPEQQYSIIKVKSTNQQIARRLNVKESYWEWLTLLGLLVTSTALVAINRRFKKIRHWSASNAGKARLTIAAVRLLLPLFGMAAGAMGLSLGVSLSPWIFGVSASISAIMFLLNFKGNKNWRINSRRFSPILMLSNVMAFAYVGQQMGMSLGESGNGAAKVFITILIVAVTLVALYLLLALSCSIACNGYEAAALVLAIGGGYLVIMGAMLLGWILWNPKSEIPNDGEEGREEHIKSRKKMMHWALILPAIIVSTATLLVMVLNL